MATFDTLGLPPDSTGKLLDLTRITQSGNQTFRQNVCIGDPTAPGNVAAVDASGNLSVSIGAPVAISGTVPVSGTVAISAASPLVTAPVPSTYMFIASPTPTASLIKGSAGRLRKVVAPHALTGDMFFFDTTNLIPTGEPIIGVIPSGSPAGVYVIDMVALVGIVCGGVSLSSSAAGIVIAYD